MNWSIDEKILDGIIKMCVENAGLAWRNLLLPQIKTLRAQVIARDAMLMQCRKTIDQQEALIREQQALIARSRQGDTGR